MQRDRWSLAATLLVVFGCHKADEPPRKSLPSVLEEAAHCSAASDCIDLGPYCPSTCAVLANKASPVLAAAVEETSAHRIAAIDSHCEIDCSSPFHGSECRQGRCVERSAGGASQCWDPAGRPVSCGRLLARFDAGSQCVPWCGGKISYRDKPSPDRIPIDEQHHRTEVWYVDYIACSECDGGL